MKGISISVCTLFLATVLASFTVSLVITRRFRSGLRVVHRESIYPGLASWSKSAPDSDSPPADLAEVLTQIQINQHLNRQLAFKVIQASDADETPDSHASTNRNFSLFGAAKMSHSRKIKSQIRSACADMDLTLHVFAWRRVQSLVRLLKSIQDADYPPGCRVPIVFHLDAGYLDAVAEVIRSFRWARGPIAILKSKSHLGLSHMMLRAWTPAKPNSLALFLEDDVSLSPLYFTFTQWCASHLLANPSKYSDVIGCSLYTPRLNEISSTMDPQNPPAWRPSQFLSQEKHLFLFQLPSSWGAVYTGEHWTGFIGYLDWRLRQDKFPEVPGSRSNMWRQSWKRYLIEYMYLKSLLMVYPSFANEASFSTNHYEVGVHSVPEGAAVHVPDQLRPDIDARFTVPLIQRNEVTAVWKQLNEYLVLVESSNQNITVVSLGHQVVAGTTELVAESKQFRDAVKKLTKNNLNIDP
ncbi:hypothetical protein HDU78_010917 [Chytriomyces hyalinus]|nr:hypothetical protein HDU78_010917 [Chytriomyces hyalinus]